MQTKKMSLANIQGKLSREEMKNIMAGSGGASCCTNGSIAHCYGTTSNCTGAAWGNCDGGANCLEYCVVSGQSQYWC